VHSKKVAIVQSNYIPWKGYFDIINHVNEFIIYDEVQYTKNDWRNRNLIKTKQGLQWLTIPVRQEGLHQSIRDTKISARDWSRKHWTSLVLTYGKARFFKEYKDFFEELYLNCQEAYLSEVNYKFLRAINQVLGINTRLSWSSDYQVPPGKTERLVALVQAVGGQEYLSGPAARSYLDESCFAAQSIKVTWMDYAGYPEYGQLYPPFAHGVSVLDLLFSEGPHAQNFMKSFRKLVP